MHRFSKRIIIAAFVFVLFGAGLVACGWFGKPSQVEATDYLMNTTVTVKIFTSNKTSGEELIQRAFDEAKRIEHIMEPRKGGGELNRINEGEYGKWRHLSPELKTVLERSAMFYKLSGGAFDPTIAAVKWLWDFENGGSIPSREDLDNALATVGFEHLTLRGDSLRIDSPGTKIDPGGVAKGYVVDCMVSFLKKQGISSGLINAGGDIYTFGKKPDGSDWIIGLRHPRLNKTIVLEHIDIPAVATSGDYERYFMQDGVRYHHILDPQTGYPADKSVSVTIWTDSAMDADILATAVFVLGPDKGIALAERLDNVEALVFYERDKSLKHAYSSGLSDIITF